METDAAAVAALEEAAAAVEIEAAVNPTSPPETVTGLATRVDARTQTSRGEKPATNVALPDHQVSAVEAVEAAAVVEIDAEAAASAVIDAAAVASEVAAAAVAIDEEVAASVEETDAVVVVSAETDEEVAAAVP